MNIIRRAQAGDETAFEALFDEYSNLVYKTAYLMVGDVYDAEDVLQDVFLQVYRSIASYDSSKGAFTTWLYRITVNRCLNRRRRHRPIMLDLEDGVDGSSQIGPGLYQQLSLERQVELDDTVGRALNHLGDKLRVVVVLRYGLDLSYAEISQIVNVPLGTVKSRLNAAIKSMRQGLEAAQPSTLGRSGDMLLRRLHD